MSYLVDKDTCKQFQKQNRQRTTLCLDGNTRRTEMKLVCCCSAVSLLCYNHFIINFQDYFTVTLSFSNMNTEYLVFLGGNFEQAEKSFTILTKSVTSFLGSDSIYSAKYLTSVFIPFTAWMQSHFYFKSPLLQNTGTQDFYLGWKGSKITLILTGLQNRLWQNNSTQLLWGGGFSPFQKFMSIYKYMIP